MGAKFKFIVNPEAGRGAVKRALPSLHRAAGEIIGANPDYDLVETAQPRHAVELARRAVDDGYETVVAVGGDGVIHEVVNGLMAAGDGHQAPAALGVIPLGSGNDFIKMLDTPLDLTAACRRLVEGEPRVVDLGRVNEHYFVNFAGFGFDTLALVEAQKIGWLTGFPLYLVAVLRVLVLNYNTPKVKIGLAEGETIQQPVTIVDVHNGRCAGGGFWLAPDAEIDDGLFDVLIADGMGRIEILRLLPDVMRGTHVGKDPVTMKRTRRVVVDSADPLPVQADGELLYSEANHLEFEMYPQSLTVIA